MVSVVNPYNQVVTVTTDSSGNYPVIIGNVGGTYSITASKTDYTPSTIKRDTWLNSPATNADIYLVPIPPDFTLTACSGIGTFTLYTGTCTITAKSIGGFTGSISYSATISPVVSGGDYISAGKTGTIVISSPGGTGSAVVSVYTGSYARSYTVTVTATSGTLSHTVSFPVYVNLPPPPPTCPPVCPV